MQLSDEDLHKIRYSGVVTDTASYMYGEFKQPGVLTNDLANNKEYKKDTEVQLLD